MFVEQFFVEWLFEIFKDKETAFTIATALSCAGLLFLIAVTTSLFYYSKRLSPLCEKLNSIVIEHPSPNDRRKYFGQQFDKIGEEFKASPLDHCWYEFEEVIIQDIQKQIYKNTIRPHHFFHLSDLKPATKLIYPPAYFSSWPNVFVGLGLLFTFIGLAAAISGAASSITGDVKVAQEGLKHVLDAASVKFITSITGLGISIVLAIVIRFANHRLNGKIEAICTMLEKCMKAITSQDVQEQQLEQLAQQTKIAQKFTDDFAVNLGDVIETRMKAVFNSSVSEALGSSISADAKEHVNEVLISIGGMKEALEEITNKVGKSGDGFASSMATAADQMQNILEKNLQDSASKISQSFSVSAEELKGSLSQAGSSFSEMLLQSSSQMKEATNELSGNVSRFVRGIETFDNQIMANIEGFEKSSKHIRETISALDNTAANVRAAGEPIASVASDFSKSSATILAASEAITSTFASIQDINAKVASYADTLSSSWQEYRERFENVDESLSKIFAEFNTNVTQILGNINAFTGDLDKTFNNAGQQLFNSVGLLNDVVSDLTESIDSTAKLAQR